MLRRPALVLLLATALGMSSSGPAAAHTEVLRAEPAPAAEVSGVVDAVVLTFLDPVQPGVTIEVRDDAGAAVPGLGVAELDEEGRVARVAFEPLTVAGGYVAEYRFTALDGDTQRQSHRFTFAPGGAPPSDPPAVSPPAPPIAEIPEGPDGTTTAVIAAGAVIAVVAGVAAFTAFRRRRQVRSTGATK